MSESGIPFFRSQNVYNDGLVYDDIKYISEEVHKSMIGTEVQAKDLLLNITGGSLGRCAIVPDEFHKGNVSQHVCILRTIVVLPEPDTPVTTVSLPLGIFISSGFTV